MGLTPALQSELGLLATRPVRVRVRNLGIRPEIETEFFDPQPPAAGTILLTQFGYGSAALTEKHKNILKALAKKIVQRMAAIPATHCIFLDVEGHEDELGDPAVYGRLGAKRAANVIQFLVARIQVEGAKIPAGDRRNVRISVSSAGPGRPMRSNVTSTGRALNRRVELRPKTDICPDVV